MAETGFDVQTHIPTDIKTLLAMRNIDVAFLSEPEQLQEAIDWSKNPVIRTTDPTFSGQTNVQLLESGVTLESSRKKPAILAEGDASFCTLSFAASPDQTLLLHRPIVASENQVFGFDELRSKLRQLPPDTCLLLTAGTEEEPSQTRGNKELLKRYLAHTGPTEIYIKETGYPVHGMVYVPQEFSLDGRSKVFLQADNLSSLAQILHPPQL